MTGRVLIVGAGPSGLTAALILARAGIPVLVLEAADAPIPNQRGAAFHPPTLEIFAELGLSDALHAIGLTVPVWQVRRRDGEVIASFDLSVLRNDTPFPYRFHLGQHLLVPVLIAALAACPCAEVRFGYPVADVIPRAHGATALTGAGEAFDADWLIGADGGRSIVRKAVGVVFEGFTWPERFAVTNVAMNLEALGFARTNYVADPDRWAVVLKLSDADGADCWRVTYPADPDGSDEDVTSMPSVQARLAEVLPTDGPFPLSYRGLYRVHQRVAETFRVGRVLLAGDAAHVNNPLGGYGLNSGVQDAANLAEKLIRVCRGEADEALMDQYVRQRRHATMKFVQASSIANKRLLDEREAARREANYAELRRVATDSRLAREHLLGSSMITSMREAAAVA